MTTSLDFKIILEALFNVYVFHRKHVMYYMQDVYTIYQAFRTNSEYLPPSPPTMVRKKHVVETFTDYDTEPTNENKNEEK